MAHRLEVNDITSTVAHTPRSMREQIAQENEQRMIKQMNDSNLVHEIKGQDGSMFFADRRSMVLQDGEEIAVIKADQVTVVARTRVLAERDGMIEIDFIVIMPKQMQGNSQSIIITPRLHRGDSTYLLEPLQVRGGLFSKLQERNYWRYSKYRDVLLWRRGGVLSGRDTLLLKTAFEKFVKFPYLDRSRFDSISRSPDKITYFYTQGVKVQSDDKRLMISLLGEVKALDGSVYRMPPKDTLQFNVSTMLYFVDTTTRYVQKVIEKYAEVKDRNFLTFKVGRSEIIDTMGNNASQLKNIKDLLNTILYQGEFYVDSISLTAASSPEGSSTSNDKLARERAFSLKKYLQQQLEYPELDTLFKVRWMGENWNEFANLVAKEPKIINKEKILELVESQKNLDKREITIRDRYAADYKFIRQNIYPSLRSVDFKYDLRRVGMIKDTIHTTEVDTLYARGLALLQERQYAQAQAILAPYEDLNAAVAMLSLNHNLGAEKILFELPESAIVLYLRAIVCSRMGEWQRGLECFKKAVELDETLEYRGNLDPEISAILRNTEPK